jgi:hypothetical protein
MRVLFVITCLACVGCGPSPEERYNTALSILEHEKRTMNEMERLAENAHEDATTATYHAFHGKDAKSIELIRKYREYTLAPDSEDGKKRLADLDAEEKAYLEFLNRLADNKSDEAKRYEIELAKHPSWIKYEEHGKRLERARKMVQNAESALGD